MMPGVDRAMPGLAVASVSMMSSLLQPEEARLEVQRSGCRQVTEVQPASAGWPHVSRTCSVHEMIDESPFLGLSA